MRRTENTKESMEQLAGQSQRLIEQATRLVRHKRAAAPLANELPALHSQVASLFAKDRRSPSVAHAVKGFLAERKSYVTTVTECLRVGREIEGVKMISHWITDVDEKLAALV